MPLAIQENKYDYRIAEDPDYNYWKSVVKDLFNVVVRPANDVEVILQIIDILQSVAVEHPKSIAADRWVE